MAGDDSTWSGGIVDRRQLQIRWQRNKELIVELLENPLTMIGIVIVISFVLMAVFAPVIAPPDSANPYQMQRDFADVREPPLTPGHPFGTTSNGGDVFYGIVWGSRLSIALSLAVVASCTIIGSVLGGIAGYVGGWVDEVIMRATDTVIAIPSLVWAIAIVSALGPSYRNIAIALGLVVWGSYARLMRAEVIHVKNEEYVDAARVTGDGRVSVFLREVLPNSLQPILVQSTLEVGAIVLTASSLSFIGLAPRGLAEWGVLVAQGQDGLIIGRWWTSVIAGLVIFLWAFAWNMIGDGLRDVLDPRTQTE